jgi:hypothetical protein
MRAMAAAFQTSFGGVYSFHSMLWHQGEQDAGDNGDNYHASYCSYLMDDMSTLLDYLRVNLPGATSTTPFIDGGLLPYWVDAVNGTADVESAIFAGTP